MQPRTRLMVARPWVDHGNPSTCARFAFDLQAATDFRHSRTHVFEAVRADTTGRIVKALPIVFDIDREELLRDIHAHRDLGSLGMTHDVVEGFLDDEKEVVPGLGGDGSIRWMIWK